METAWCGGELVRSTIGQTVHGRASDATTSASTTPAAVGCTASPAVAFGHLVVDTHCHVWSVEGICTTSCWDPHGAVILAAGCWAGGVVECTATGGAACAEAGAVEGQEV